MLSKMLFVVLITLSVNIFAMEIDGSDQDWSNKHTVDISLIEKKYKITSDINNIYLFISQNSLTPVIINDIPIFLPSNKDFYINLSLDNIPLLEPGFNKEIKTTLKIGLNSWIYSSNLGVKFKAGENNFLISQRNNKTEIQIPRSMIGYNKNILNMTFLVPEPINFFNNAPSINDSEKRSIYSDAYAQSIIYSQAQEILSVPDPQVHGFVNVGYNYKNTKLSSSITAYYGKNGVEWKFTGSQVNNSEGLNLSTGIAISKDNLDAFDNNGLTIEGPWIGASFTMDDNKTITSDGFALFIHASPQWSVSHDFTVGEAFGDTYIAEIFGFDQKINVFNTSTENENNLNSNWHDTSQNNNSFNPNYGGSGDNHNGNNNSSGHAGGTSENSDGCSGCNTPWGGRAALN